MLHERQETPRRVVELPVWLIDLLPVSLLPCGVGGEESSIDLPLHQCTPLALLDGHRNTSTVGTGNPVLGESLHVLRFKAVHREFSVFHTTEQHCCLVRKVVNLLLLLLFLWTRGIM